MSEINEVYRRLDDGICPSPKDIDLIIDDIRRQRAIYSSGSKPKKDAPSADQLMEFKKIMKIAKPSTPLKRRA